MLRKTTGILGLALLFGTFVACKGDKDSGDDTDDTDTDDTEITNVCAEDGISPCIEEGQIYCEFIGGSAFVY